MKAILFSCVLIFAACTPLPYVYRDGPLTISVGAEEGVDSTCRWLLGRQADVHLRYPACLDVRQSTIYTIPDARYLAHERCHWDQRTANHTICPLPD